MSHYILKTYLIYKLSVTSSNGRNSQNDLGSQIKYQPPLDQFSDYFKSPLKIKSKIESRSLLARCQTYFKTQVTKYQIEIINDQEYYFPDQINQILIFKVFNLKTREYASGQLPQGLDHLIRERAYLKVSQEMETRFRNLNNISLLMSLKEEFIDSTYDTNLMTFDSQSYSMTFSL